MHRDIEHAFTLDGRTAVVTGAASGIGRGTAIVLAKAGASLVLADIDEPGLEATRAQIDAAPDRIALRRTDVTDREDVEALADFAAARFGGIDVWANIAGVIGAAPVTEMTKAELDRILSVNLQGTYWGCAAAARRMASRGKGSIVNISSAGADMPAPGLSAYAMSKAAVNMLTRTLATEVGRQGVRVNAVAPGFVETPMVAYRYRTPDGEVDEKARARLLQLRAEGSALGRIGEPSDIAYAILCLASDASRFVTGQILRPNGGAVMP
jgi:3-oxoacyl-[acyl-carrier protein] reductase